MSATSERAVESLEDSGAEVRGLVQRAERVPAAVPEKAVFVTGFTVADGMTRRLLWDSARRGFFAEVRRRAARDGKQGAGAWKDPALFRSWDDGTLTVILPSVRGRRRRLG